MASAGQGEGTPLEAPSQAILDGIEAHRLWLDSGGREGEQAVLGDLDLRGLALGGINLQFAVLLGAQLDGADLHGASLQKAELNQASASGVNLRDANLRKARFNGADLSDSDLSRSKLRGASLERAVLERANLREADLRKADLSEARLDGADLRGAKLRSAELRETDLGGADLRGAHVRRANLAGANLFNTLLRDANLEGANLTGVTGLLGGQLAATNLSGARLPKEIAAFDGLSQVADISRAARTVLVLMLSVCAFAWLAIAATPDLAGPAGSGTWPLPIVGTGIGPAWFYLAAPLLLLGFYIHLHAYLQRLWRALGALPAVFPDGRSLVATAHPWLLNSLVRRQFTLLREARAADANVEEALAILLAWVAVPATALGLLWRYLPAQDGLLSALHAAVLLLSLVFGVWSYRQALATLRGEGAADHGHQVEEVEDGEEV